MVEPEPRNSADFVGQERRTTPLLQGDSELIYSFSVPDAKEHDDEFFHINKDWRMANLKAPDKDFLNKANIAMRMAHSFLGGKETCVRTMLHDEFIVLNMSVSDNGKAMELLVTRKQQQHATIVRDTKGFMSKKDDGSDPYGG